VSRTVLIAVAAVLVGSAAAADPPAADIPALVKALGADDFDEREAAEKALVKLGAKAVMALREATRSDDPEVVFRAKRALVALEWAVPGDAPEEVAALIRRYRDSSPDRRAALRVPIFEAAAKAGKAGVPALRFMADKVTAGRPDATVQAELLWSVRRAVPRLLLAGRDADVEAILDVAVDYGPPDQAAADYAAFQFDRGKVSDVLPAWEKDARPAAPWVLVNLHRMRGDQARATALADRLGKAYRNVLHADAGEWGALVDRLDGKEGQDLRLTLLRLAGRTKELDEAVRKLTDKSANPWNPNEPPGAAVQALLQAGRADAADRACVDRGGWPGHRLQIAAARFRIAAALAVLPPAEEAALKKDRPELWKNWQWERAKLLVRLGRKKEARDALFSVAEAFPNKSEEGGPGLQFLNAEMTAGFPDAAFARAAKLLAGDGGEKAVPFVTLANPLFPNHSAVAGTLWDYLRSSSHTGKPPAETLALIRRLLAGTATADEVTTSLDALRRSPAAGAHTTSRRRDGVLAVAEAAGRWADAEPVLKEAAESTDPAPPMTEPDVGPWLAWGKFLSDRGRDRDAAAVYLRGWERYPDSAVLLYRSGLALVRAGDQAEGTRRVDAAFRGLLGNEDGWTTFLDHLIGDGAPADRKRAADALGRVFWGRGSPSIAAIRRALAYRGAGDYAAAAAAHDRAMYEFAAAGNTFFPDLWRYYRVPAWSRAYRAFALLDAGKPKEAAAELREYLKVAPEDVGEVCKLVPRFDKAGAKAEADEFYRSVRDAILGVLKDHPNSALYHNEAAWLAANCRRDLDQALTHAKKAVELAPDQTGYVDTLAEVHFRRGERDEAVKIMARLVDQTKGRKAYFRKQLDRFKAGDVAGEPPEED
jgi:tetratricopeptide (TPR) repeat protein